MTEKRDTDRVPAPEAEVLLDLLDGLVRRGLASRCTRVVAGATSIDLQAQGSPPEDPKKAKRAREEQDAETLFEAS